MAGGTGRIPLGFLGESLTIPKSHIPTVHVSEVYDAIIQGKKGGYPSDIKVLYIVGCNLINQFLNTNKGVNALTKPEFIVAHELFLTPTARYADILLPVSSFAEANDLTRPWPSGPYLTFINKSIEPPGECKSDWEIACALAEKLGIKEDFNNLSEDEWLRKFINETPDYVANIKDYDKFKREGIHRVKLQYHDPIVAVCRWITLSTALLLVAFFIGHWYRRGRLAPDVPSASVTTS